MHKPTGKQLLVTAAIFAFGGTFMVFSSNTETDGLPPAQSAPTPSSSQSPTPQPTVTVTLPPEPQPTKTVTVTVRDMSESCKAAIDLTKQLRDAGYDVSAAYAKTYDPINEAIKALGMSDQAKLDKALDRLRKVDERLSAPSERFAELDIDFESTLKKCGE